MSRPQRLARLVLALLALAVATPALALPEGMGRNPPYIVMRSLQTLQEQIAHGNAAAQAAQPKLMAHIAEEFEAADPAVWKDLRNAHAAVLFLLSGGNPAVIRSILQKATMPAETDVLIKGSLAYAEGQDDVARKLLLTVSPGGLPTNLGGHLALVEAGLLSSQDSAKANVLLDMARLLVPGTLVEEAALRRQIFILGDNGALDKFALLSRQYIRRYQASIFADNFRRRFMSVAADLAAKGNLAGLTKLEGSLAEMSPEGETIAYLDLARIAVVRGQIATTRYAAGRAMALAKARSADAARAALYLAAIMVVGKDYDQGALLLKGVTREALPDKDRGLYDAVSQVAHVVRVLPEDRPDSAPGPETGGDTSFSALVQQARATLKDSAALLQKPKP